MDLMSPVGSHSLETSSEQSRGKEPMYNNFLSPTGGTSGKNKFKSLPTSSGSSCHSSPSLQPLNDNQQPCSSKSLTTEEPQINQFESQEIRMIMEKSRERWEVIYQIRNTFSSLFKEGSEQMVTLRQKRRSKQSVLVKRRRMDIGTKIKFELYGDLCINWLQNTIKFIKSFYQDWICKAEQNVIELKYTADEIEYSDDHISALLYVKDSKEIMQTWEESENVFLQHAVSDLSTYILKLRNYKIKEQLHQEYTIIEQNIYALLDSLQETLSTLRKHYKMYTRHNADSAGCSEESSEDGAEWVTEEITDIECDKVYTCESEVGSSSFQ